MRLFGCGPNASGFLPVRLLGALLICFSLLIGFDAVALAQTATGTITGTITDPQGAAITGATIAVRNADTGVSEQVKTTDAGTYTAPLLQPGKYDVTATQSGFATVQNKGVTLQVGQTVRVDVQMPVASQQSLVTVTAENPLLDTERTEQSQNVTESLVTNLPISSRRWEQFVLLTPGLTADGSAGRISFHGLNGMYNSNNVDGANNNNSYNAVARGGSNDGYVYSGDSIREFQVSSNSFNAEIGQAAGGAVNAVTKSGGSQYHGDLFYNGRAANFNALDPAIKASTPAGQTPTQSIHQQHQYGGSLGGPIIKDKLFFFVTADQYRKVTPIAYTTTTSNLASLFTTHSASNANGSCPAAISAAQCAAAANYVLNQDLGVFPRLLWQDVELVKLDYQLGKSNHFNAVANIRDWKEPNGTAFASSSNSGVGAAGVNFIQDRFVIANWNALIGSNKVNEFRYQWGADNSFSTVYLPGPAVGLTNLFAYGTTGTIPGYTAEFRHQVTDSFSFTHGSHTFKTGVDLNFIREHIAVSRGASGQYTYSTGVAPAVAGTCPASGAPLALCDWLLDLYNVPDGAGAAAKTGLHWNSFSQIKDQRYPNNQLGNVAGTDNFNTSDYGFYFQDTWKVRSNITVNAGLRYDIQMLPQPTNPNHVAPLLSLYTSTVNIDYGGIQPRLGIAWNITKNTVIRGGGGIFFAKTTTSTISSARRTSGEREQQFNCTTATAASSASVCNTLRFPDLLYSQQTVPPGTLPLPGARQPAIASSNPANTAGATNVCEVTPLQCVVRGISPDDERPRAYQLQVAVERQFPGNINVSASYIFTRATRLPAHYDVNLAPPGTRTYDVLDTAGNTSLSPTVPFFTSRIDPTIGAIIAEFSKVNSRYNGMVITARKPMSHGVEILANYTLSKSSDNGMVAADSALGGAGGMFLGSDGILNPYNQNLEQSSSSTNVPQRFTGSVVWQPGFGKGFNGFRKTLLDGWSMSGSVTASSGIELYSGQISNTAIIAGSGAVDGGMTGSILDTNGRVIGGRLAWLPRNSFALPGYSNLDLRLTKLFTVHERFNFELRGEAFNLMNKTIVQAVNTSAYTLVAPGSPGCSAAHTNTCVVPQAGFGVATTTSGNLLGARQLQAGIRFTF